MERKKHKKQRWIAGLIIIGATIFALSWVQLSNNLVYFYTPEEAYAKGAELTNKLIRVGGMVQQGSIVKNGEQVKLNFILTDFNNHDFDVEYLGTPPDMFKEMQGVVVEGRMEFDNKKLIAQKLMVKHSEEYKKPGDGHSTDKEMLQKSLFKD